MYVYLSKLLPLLLMPVGVVLILGFTAVILLICGRRKVSLLLMIFAMGLLWIAATPVVASLLYGNLERAFPPVPLDKIPRSGCIILLGGAVGKANAPRVDIELLEAVDRVYQAAKLYRERKAETIIVAAGNQPWDVSLMSEAVVISELLQEWGVPERAIVRDDDSRNTRENALNVRRHVVQSNCDRPLLVTSAAHMPRAVASFDAVGIAVFPVSVDVRVARKTQFWLMDFLPQAQSLAMTSEALREWTGIWVYRWRGWN